MMTKKDFIGIAKAISQIDDDSVRKEQTETQIQLLRETNPRFDAQRFREFVEQHHKWLRG